MYACDTNTVALKTYWHSLVYSKRITICSFSQYLYLHSSCLPKTHSHSGTVHHQKRVIVCLERGGGVSLGLVHTTLNNDNIIG